MNNGINEVVRLHGMWLRGEDGGVRAYLSGADLSECRGIRFAQCSWDGHGESGRMLTGALIDGDVRVFCGCFSGTVAELEQYIADGDPKLAESRTFALRFVLACLLFGGRDE